MKSNQRPRRRPTVCVDFDGVLHTYHGWTGSRATGGLVPGATDGLQALRAAGFRVVVLTSREKGAVWAWRVPSNTPGGLTETVRAFLADLAGVTSQRHDDGEKVKP